MWGVRWRSRRVERWRLRRARGMLASTHCVPSESSQEYLIKKEENVTENQDMQRVSRGYRKENLYGRDLRRRYERKMKMCREIFSHKFRGIVGLWEVNAVKRSHAGGLRRPEEGVFAVWREGGGSQRCQLMGCGPPHPPDPRRASPFTVGLAAASWLPVIALQRCHHEEGR